MSAATVAASLPLSRRGFLGSAEPGSFMDGGGGIACAAAGEVRAGAQSASSKRKRVIGPLILG